MTQFWISYVLYENYAVNQAGTRSEILALVAYISLLCQQPHETPLQ